MTSSAPSPMPLKKQLKIAYLISSGVFKRHKKKALFICAFALGTLVVGSALIQVSIAKQSNTFVVGMVGKYTKQTLPLSIEQQISQGLTTLQSTGEATAAAAKDWQVSNDGKEYTVHLQDNLHWHDQSPFVAKDLQALFASTINTTVVNDHELKFTLSTPYAPLPIVLSKPLLKGSMLAGLGDFRVLQIEEADKYVTSIQIQSLKNANHIITYRFYPTTTDMLTALKLGELQAASGFFNPTSLTSWQTLKSYTKSNYRSVVTLLLSSNVKELDDKTIRQALAYAIPKDIFPGEVAISPIPPPSWAFNADVKEYVFDLNHAKELLQKKGIKEGDLAFTLTTTQTYSALAQQIADNWNKIGIKTTVSVSKDITKDFQIALIRLELPIDPDQYTLWHSLQKQTNLSGYASERVDKLLEDGRVTQDQSKRTKIYQDFQKYLVDDSPAIFLYYPNEQLLINRRFDQPMYRQLLGFQ